MQQLPLSVRIADRAVFQSFLPGANQQALERLAAIANAGAGLCWLSGPRSCGKTHLLQAVSVAAGAKAPATYIPLREVFALGPEALEGMTELACVTLDDLDAVAGKLEWERALFRLYRETEDRGGIAVFASRLPPAALAWALPDFASRAVAMPGFALQPLDETGRSEALRLRARLRGVDLPDETLRWLERRFPRDMGSLFVVLDALDQAALVAQRRLTVPFIRSVLRE